VKNGENMDHVKECILKKRRVIINVSANMFGGILFSSVYSIFKDSPRGGIQGLYFFFHHNKPAYLNVWLKTEDCHSIFSKIQDVIKGNKI
jgi:hypothetical protein